MSSGLAANRATIVDQSFTEAVQALGEPGRRRELPPGLAAAEALALVRAQLVSRHIDLLARELRRKGHGYYTIGSAGHEGNVAVAHALAPSDPAFLHYRSGAFFLERARQAGYPHAVRDVLLGMMAARAEPIAGGRHKVWGSVALAIPPQTSTIASHLPKAVGAAAALDLRCELRRAGTLAAGAPPPDDAIVMCSFGDASVNHSTAQGALNHAGYLAYRDVPVPILFVCEDNGIGISVDTPEGWVAEVMRARPGIRYSWADGLDLPAAVQAARAAAEHVRSTRRPAFLHLGCVRLLGHAGSDAEIAYRSVAQIREIEARDPLIASARFLVETGVAGAAQVLAEYEDARRQVAALAEQALAEPGLRDAGDVMWPIAPRDRAAITACAARLAATPPRTLPEGDGRLTLAEQLNQALAELCEQLPELLIFGEDIGRKGGIYGVTKRLQRRFGPRVFDTVLDEQSVLGLAIGAGHVGLLPVAEIQYLAFLHNAEDQLRGEASMLQFFSQAQLANPMVVRIPSYGYQKGFGGHFHNDNSVAVLRDLPGVVIASPASGDDAAAMLRTCVAAARTSGSVCVFLEPIALYHTADLYEAGDGGWLTRHDPGAQAELGRARLRGIPEGEPCDLLMITFANGVPMCLRVARRLGVRCQVLDLRWLAPLPVDDMLRAARSTRRVLVVDETRRTGGVSEGILAELLAAGYDGKLARVTSKDSPIPLGPAADHVLLSERELELAARDLLA